MKDWTGNASGVWKTVGASNHAAGEREQDDYYATDPSAVDKLLAVERPHPLIWECAAGGGHLARRLKECGFEVYASDILDRGYPLDVHLDFLTANWFDIPRGGERFIRYPDESALQVCKGICTESVGTSARRRAVLYVPETDVLGGQGAAKADI